MDYFKALIDWRKNTSFFMLVLLLITTEAPYLANLKNTPDSPWYNNINYILIILLTVPAVLVGAYILFKRNYIPKAKNAKTGIVFCISYTEPQQYKTIYDKFIKPFKRLININRLNEYDVVIVNDYVAEKYCQRFEKHGKDAELKFLKKSNCQILILGDCVNGGDGEDLFCKLNLTLGIVHPALIRPVEQLLCRDIGVAFSPLEKTIISKKTQTKDFEDNTDILQYVFKFILATTRLYCNNVEDAIKLFLEIKSLPTSSDRPTILQIKESIDYRLGVCYYVYAKQQYMMYQSTRDPVYLEAVFKAINMPCIKLVKYDIMVLKGICLFVLNKDVAGAISCMNSAKSDPVIKFNKVFLKLYRNNTQTNINKAYHTYKYIDKLPQVTVDELERFIYDVYKQDEQRTQLMFLLSMIYNHQGNDVLAKYCYDIFCKNNGYIKDAPSLKPVLDFFDNEYKDVEYTEEEVHF